MKKAAIFIILAITLQAHSAHASAGFLSGNIWYSRAEFFAGDNVRVYSAVFNSGDWDIEGTITFSVNGQDIGNADFIVEKEGDLERVWVDWTAKEGTRKIVARVTDARYTEVGAPDHPPEVVGDTTAENTITVQRDTDNDGVGDPEDKDDDNDNISDREERELGTDPKEPNTEKEIKEARERQRKEKAEVVEKTIDKAPEAAEGPLRQADSSVANLLQGQIDSLKEKQRALEEELERARGGRNAEEDNSVPEFSDIKRQAHRWILSSLVWLMETRFLIYVVGTALVIAAIIKARRWHKSKRNIPDALK